MSKWCHLKSAPKRSQIPILKPSPIFCQPGAIYLMVLESRSYYWTMPSKACHLYALRKVLVWRQTQKRSGSRSNSRPSDSRLKKQPHSSQGGRLVGPKVQPFDDARRPISCPGQPSWSHGPLGLGKENLCPPCLWRTSGLHPRPRESRLFAEPEYMKQRRSPLSNRGSFRPGPSWFGLARGHYQAEISRYCPRPITFHHF